MLNACDEIPDSSVEKKEDFSFPPLTENIASSVADWDPLEDVSMVQDPLEISYDEAITIPDYESAGEQNPRRNPGPAGRVSSSHGQETHFHCPNCPSVYNRQDNLRQHLRWVCHQKPRFACPYCAYVCKRTYNVYGHIRSKHPNEEVCYRDLKNSNALVSPYTKSN